jgi:diguanylate cyclase (GGDEF)-like protein
MSRRVLSCTVLTLLLLGVNTLAFYVTVTRLKSAAGAVDRSLRRLDMLKDIASALSNVEAERRRYIIHGDQHFLNESLFQLRAAKRSQDRFRTLSSADTIWQAQTETLDRLVAREIASVLVFIELHHSQGLVSTLRAINEKSGAELGRLQALVFELSVGEYRLLFQRTEQSTHDSDLALVTFVVGVALDVVLSLLIGVLARRELRERRAAGRALAYAATHDPLTLLPNRILFADRLTAALSASESSKARPAIFFIDLDRFKNINDALGHEVGDRLLTDIARRLSGCVRGRDTVARQGGDEFVVMVPQFDDRQDLTLMAEKILAAVAKPLPVAGKEFHITASIGMAIAPGDGTDMQSLLKRADMAMYRAKKIGGNNYQFCSEQANDHSVRRLQLECALRHALDRSELLLHYQPKVSVQTQRMTGIEALIRWRHPELGLIAPNDWIPIAEETGLIVPIGKWALRQACAQIRTWQTQGLVSARVAVNLSARQFAHASLVENVRSALDESGLDADWLELEITESMVMDDPENAVRLLTELKAMGIHLSIDDFGTGYSSLAYLKQFPIDAIKVDRSFIRDLPADASNLAITQAIILMSHSLGLKVVAEGVENEAQVRVLREHQCDEMQGYYFSKPLPEHALIDYLRNEQKMQRGRLVAVGEHHSRT